MCGYGYYSVLGRVHVELMGLLLESLDRDFHCRFFYFPCFIVTIAEMLATNATPSPTSVTVKLLKLKSEHHDGDLTTLEEIALHQLNLEEIGTALQMHCRRLRILLLQNNQICRIENVYKLKELRYLNLALNNIQRLEGLQSCEMMSKLDLTCNFVAELADLWALAECEHLTELYMTGNPITEKPNYRLIAIRILPQLKQLDGRQIVPSERIRASQLPEDLLPVRPAHLPKKHEIDGLILPAAVETLPEMSPDSMTTHDPVSRIQAARATELQKRPAPQLGSQKPSTEFTADKQALMDDINPRFNKTTGKIMQRNHIDVDFQFTQPSKTHLELHIAFPRTLDTSFIDVDVHKDWVGVVVKKRRAIHLELAQMVDTHAVECLRSQSSGALVIKMKLLHPEQNADAEDMSTTGYIVKSKEERRQEREERERKQREEEVARMPYLSAKSTPHIRINVVKHTQKPVPNDFIDDPEVPPLI